MKTTLILAAIYNVCAGLSVIFLFDQIAPLIDFEGQGNPLFRLFTGGTAVGFGAAYALISRSYDENHLILSLGTGLKYWAFLIALYCFLYHDLPAEALILFGVINLVFGHIGDNNLHLTVTTGNHDDLERISEIVYAATSDVGGSIAAEHGIGISRREYLHLSRSESEIALMRKLKATLDPKGILNRGRS